MEDVHIDASIVTEIAKEFDIEQFKSMEVDVIDALVQSDPSTNKSFVIESLGEVTCEKMEEDKHADDLVIIMQCVIFNLLMM